ncbi:MAG: FG-GAP repeat protein [Alphaproteobacteria bacterium]|nr:FG-GAP repeat protein [Alphaproteobacteria bacterium]
MNGDGYEDIAITAPNLAAAGEPGGRTFVYAGSPRGPLPSPSWYVDRVDWGPPQHPLNHGDFDGDGFDDFVFGERAYLTIQPARASVYLGSPAGLLAAPAWMEESNRTFSDFATALATGDVNGDGLDDLVVGDQSQPNGTDPSGAVHVYLGNHP